MVKASKEKEIILTVDNRVGKLEEISKTIKDNGINVRGISAWVIDDKAYFRLICSDNEKAIDALKNLGKIEEKGIVVVDMPDEVGQLFLLASRLKDNKIDLNYIHGTTATPGESAMIILSCDNDDKALEVISG